MATLIFLTSSMALWYTLLPLMGLDAPFQPTSLNDNERRCNHDNFDHQNLLAARVAPYAGVVGLPSLK
jgi:hypothetical protein